MIKEYDIIVFGATGFTGKLICEYLLKHEEVKNIKWAIAGRNKYKLEQVVEEFNLENIEVQFLVLAKARALVMPQAMTT